MIRRKARDKNLRRHPITLLYAEKEEGPWQPIATNLENTGKFVWKVPANALPRILVRVEAVDLAGNVGSAQTKDTVKVDLKRPKVGTVNITPVDSAPPPRAQPTASPPGSPFPAAEGGPHGAGGAPLSGAGVKSGPAVTTLMAPDEVLRPNSVPCGPRRISTRSSSGRSVKAAPARAR